MLVLGLVKHTVKLGANNIIECFDGFTLDYFQQSFFSFCILYYKYTSYVEFIRLE